MPELPDIAAYISALETRIVGQRLEHVRLASPFLLRTVQPPVADVEGRMVRELRRIGKRIAIGVEGDLWLVLHLMIAGRLHWRPARPSWQDARIWQPSIFPTARCVLTEAGTKRRASLSVFAGEEGTALRRPGRHRCFHQRSQLVSRRPYRRKPHAQASSYRSAHRQRHRQRLFRRNSARGPTLADHADAQIAAGRMGTAVRCDTRDTPALDRPAAGGGEG